MLKFIKNIKNRKNKKKINHRKQIIIVAVLLGLSILAITASFRTRAKYLEDIYGDIPPKLELLGDSQIRVALNDSYEEPGFIAKDARGKDISKEVVVEGEINSALEGTYILHYVATDRYGNESQKQIRVVIVGELSKGRNQNSEKKDELILIIKAEIKNHEAALLEYGEDNCKKVDYLTPYIHSHYSEDDLPERNLLRSTVREVLSGESENAYLNPSDRETLMEIIELELEKHADSILQYGEDSCGITDYLIPYVLAHYDEKNTPNQNFMRTTIKEVLGIN